MDLLTRSQAMAFFNECEETAWQEGILLRFLASLLVLISILYLGSVGIVLGVIICCVLKFAGKLPRIHNARKISIYLNSQLNAAVAAYVLFIPIDYYIIQSDYIRFLAHV
ncbi:hypothetical protein [Labrenzia sp. OB1]|uniref:hypothetical protein n=1 Tax=Labrenzia sp. OB1 TaxID=1561204 RepID=UPI0012E7987F|nr:hypothetical protein [Labrenzia sp. OB1]